MYCPKFDELTIQTSPEVAQQAIQAIRDGAGTGNWAILGNNCTTACVKVLQDLGLSPGNKGKLPWTPSKLWTNLRLKYSGKSNQIPAWRQPLSAGTSMIQNGSSAISGTDYGNPRYGTNTFDFIMQELKAPTKACVTTQGAKGPETQCQ